MSLKNHLHYFKMPRTVEAGINIKSNSYANDERDDAEVPLNH